MVGKHPGVLVGIAIVLVSCAPPSKEGPPAISDAQPRPAREPGAVDVVLVVIDTERADYTSTYGGRWRTTPNLTRLAKEGVLFENALAPAPWTVPSMYSMFTGVYPSEHGMVTGWTEGLQVKGQGVLPEEAVTLTEVLRDAGWETFGVCTNFHLARRFGFAQGFDHFVGEDFASLPMPNMAVESLAPAVRKSGRYFLWLHYFDPHDPYYPNRPWFDDWNRSPYTSHRQVSQDVAMAWYRQRSGLPAEAALSPANVMRVYKAGQVGGMQTSRMFEMALEEGITPRDEWIDFLRAAYLSELRLVDEAMLEALETLDVDEDTLVIVTADHGEEIFDRGHLGHRQHNSLYQELIHVPLVVLLPGRKHAGTVVSEPVSLLDIMPTILEVTGTPAPPGLSGRSLIPLIEGENTEPRRFFAEVGSGGVHVRSVIEWPWKLVVTMGTDESMLFHLEDDPGETRDLADAHPDRVRELEEALSEWIDGVTVRWHSDIAPELTEDEILQLKMLGYVQD